jgi:hypothetical protein
MLATIKPLLRRYGHRPELTVRDAAPCPPAPRPIGDGEAPRRDGFFCQRWFDRLLQIRETLDTISTTKVAVTASMSTALATTQLTTGMAARGGSPVCPPRISENQESRRYLRH